jgi:integrase
MKLTKQSMADLVLPPGKIDHTAWDDELPGFGVRLRQGANGVRKTYRIQYRVGLQQRSKHLDVRKTGLEDARKVARQFFAKAHLGVDPGVEKAKARATAAAAKLTLAAVADRYLAVKQQALQRGEYSASSYEAAVRYFNVHWAPLRGRPIDGIKRPEVATRLQELTTEFGRSAAAKARYTLSALYTWAMGEGLCEANPVVATNNPEAGVMARERVLSDAELKAVFGACADDDVGNIIKLLAFTGCRRDEIAALRWHEIDLETGVLTLPATRTKNRRELRLPLPAPALKILRSVPRRDGPCVFGNVRHGFTGWSAAKRKLDARIAATGARLPPWTVHDLRRTFRTGLGRLNVPPHIAELAINHVKSGIVAVYDKYRYEPEIADALAQWAEHVTVVEGRGRKPPERKSSRSRLASVTN